MTRYKHKKGLSGKAILAIVLAVVIVIAAIITTWAIGSEGFTQNNPLHFFNRWGTASAQPDNKDEDKPPEEDLSGLTVTINSESELITLAVDDNNETAESVTVTATVSPINATNRGINFWLAWETSTSANILDYMSLTIDGNSATVTCLQPFYMSIILHAQVSKTDITATCNFDYLMPMVRTTGLFSTNSKLTSTSVSNSKIKVGLTDTKNYFLLNDADLTNSVYGAGTKKGSIYINYIEFWMHLSSGKIAETDSFANLCDYLTSNNLGSVTVRTDKDNRPKFNIYGYYGDVRDIGFNVNYLDFFKFSKISEQNEEFNDEIKNYCKAALLEACGPDLNQMQIPVNISYKYTLGNKSFTYNDTPYVTFDFSDLTDATTNVTVDKNEYVFGG